jgi:hypothetical protein
MEIMKERENKKKISNAKPEICWPHTLPMMEEPPRRFDHLPKDTSVINLIACELHVPVSFFNNILYLVKYQITHKSTLL